MFDQLHITTYGRIRLQLSAPAS